MNKKQMDERRDAKRTIFKFYMFLVAISLIIGAPLDYLLRDSTDTLYGSLALLALTLVCFSVAEIRDVIQRQVIED